MSKCAMENLNRDLNNVIFTDKASFCTWVAKCTVFPGKITFAAHR